MGSGEEIATPASGMQGESRFFNSSAASDIQSLNTTMDLEDDQQTLEPKVSTPTQKQINVLEDRAKKTDDCQCLLF